MNIGHGRPQFVSLSIISTPVDSLYKNDIFHEIKD